MNRIIALALAVLLAAALPATGQQRPLGVIVVPPPIPNNVVPIAQIFDYNVPDPSVLLGNVSLAWGPTNSAGAPFPVPGLPSFVYWPVYRNDFGINVNLQCTGCVTGGTNKYWDWFLHNMPWAVEYQSDQLTPGWQNDTINVPLNFTDPAVVAFIETGAGSGGQATSLAGALGSYVGVALDNAHYENAYGWSGHFQGAVAGPACTETNPGCGTGVWHQDFPASDPNGAAWGAASGIYTQHLRSWINQQGKLTLCNFAKPSPGVVTLAIPLATTCGDLVLAEDFSMDGNVGGACSDGMTPSFTPYVQWLGLYQYAQSLSQSMGVAFVDYICPGQTVQTVTQQQIAWGVANFLLLRGGHSYYTMKDEEVASYVAYPASFAPNCGTAAWHQPPLALSYVNSGGSYERILQVDPGDAPGSVLCYVEVNPHDTGGPSTTYTLPPGTWVDQFNHSVPSGLNSLAPKTGMTIKQVG